MNSRSCFSLAEVRCCFLRLDQRREGVGNEDGLNNERRKSRKEFKAVAAQETPGSQARPCAGLDDKGSL